MPDFMRALVTGGAGFIGSNLVDALLERGDEVTVLDNISTGRRENLEQALAGGAELAEVDLRDAEAVSGARRAGRARGDLPPGRAGGRAQVGGGPGLRLGRERGRHRERAERRAAPTAWAGWCSPPRAGRSTARRQTIPATEDHPVAPEAPYGLSKFCAENYCALFTRLHGLSTVALRFGNVYGPRQDPLGEAGVIAIFCGRRARRRPAGGVRRRPPDPRLRPRARHRSAPTSWRRSRTRAARSTSAAARRSR